MEKEANKPIEIVNSRSFSLDVHDNDHQSQKVTQDLKEKNPNVMFIVARSCNLNVVAYEGMVDKKHPTKIDSRDPLDIYWLNLEKKHRDDARAKKQKHDRDELSWPERRFGYGAKAKLLKNGTFRLFMNADKSIPIRLAIDPKSNRPRAFLELDPTHQKAPGTQNQNLPLCILDRIFVHVIYKLGAIPDVDWLVYYGRRVSDGSLVHQKVIRHIK
jgi:hypothetical protein